VAYRLLHKYQDRVLCFNDDIQGTAAVALSGIHTSLRITGGKFTEQKIMFLGAGSAATGTADLIVKALMQNGITEEKALNAIALVDIEGLLVNTSASLMEHNSRYAKHLPKMSFKEAVEAWKPTILIGASGAKGVFTKEIIERMCAINERPVIFALSNPTSRAECTAEEAYQWSKGKVIFASGSPFNPVELHGKTYIPGQANNVYIFPGIGLAAMAAAPKTLPDTVFLVAAEELAKQVHQSDLDTGTIFPKMNTLRTISFEIAVAVANHLYDTDNARFPKPLNIRKHIQSLMYDPTY
jgi:malate dehydrogenase (oxaloacetate-decarboxylating)(NADP+)